MKALCALVAILLPFTLAAGEVLSPEETDAVKQKLAKVVPGIQVDSVRQAPMAGFYEVALGTRLMYMTHDGRYLLLGDEVEVEQRDNLTEVRRAELVATRIDAVGKENMIVIAPDQPSHHITVFTDVDCPYCAKFHRDVPKLNAAGIEVRYLLFPRSGIGSPSYQRAVSVWCSDDPIKWVGIAKAGGEVAAKECNNPVKESIQLGREVGISGTPAIILENGRMIPGYVPPPRLLAELGIAPSAAAREK
jgi:thiol:disulfide interchange protein DsbC